MDLTVPYTFYPTALPHWIAWTLFVLAIAGGVTAAVVRTRQHGWVNGLLVGIVSLMGFVIATMVLSMVITFFVHDA